MADREPLTGDLGSSVPEPDLGVTLCGVRLPNPTVLASGVLGLSQEILGRLARQILAPLGVPIIASIFANTIYDVGVIARYIGEAEKTPIFPSSARAA